MNKPYYIIEVANTHGGDIDYIIELIKQFEFINENCGIKFQCFHSDTISLPDFRSYKIYQEFFFSEDQWKKIINEARKTKDIWIDIFDVYGLKIFENNFDEINGIKLQSSVLQNYEVLNNLSKIGMDNKKLILNIAAKTIQEIKSILSEITERINPEETFLEFGYQAFPTKLSDCGLSKIKLLRENFKNKLVFADHVDGKSEDAIYLPAIATMFDIEIIEKHVMLKSKETKYDFNSSLDPSRFKKMISKVNEYSDLFKEPFINNDELKYLEKTIMKPILNKNVAKGSIPSLEKDFIFRRTKQSGLNVTDIKNLLKNKYVLRNDIKKGNTLSLDDFKKARIGIAVICRMKSSRLEKKALKKIGDLSSIEYCIKNVLKLDSVDDVILATSDHPDDLVLKNYTYSEKVKFHIGSQDDVMQRILDVSIINNLDIICRVTADNPFTSNEIFQKCIDSHFINGSDLTSCKEGPIGLTSRIFTVEALKRAIKLFPVRKYSEYLPFYFENNPEHFKINKLICPEEFKRNYRLTLDYENDLIFFNKIDEKFNLDEQGKNYTLKLLKFLDENPKILEINSNEIVKYETDKKLIQKIKKKTTINKNILGRYLSKDKCHYL